MRGAVRDRLRFLAFYIRHARILGEPPKQEPGERGTALFVFPRAPNIEVNLTLMRGLRAHGFTIAVLDRSQLRSAPYFRLAGARTILPFDVPDPSKADIAAASAILRDSTSLEDLIAVDFEGVRVGRIAASSAMRAHIIGDLDLTNKGVRGIVTTALANSIGAARLAGRILGSINPSAAIFQMPEYTPGGELFDASRAAGIDTIVCENAHRNSSLFLKRYLAANTDHHAASLSDRTWELARTMTWPQSARQRLRDELEDGYARRDWYGAARTQFATRRVDEADVRRELAIVTGRKTAFIFAHILFDAPFNWASPLYTTYEKWLIETVRAACRNEALNWVVKIHPANRVKLGGAEKEPAEIRALEREFGKLPPHVRIMPAESRISTLSCFEVMDYCVTVRGTIGIEAAARGIPVLTAGAARYSGKGFTIDSTSQSEYAGRLLSIQDIPRLDPAQLELARRYAYALLVMRPFELDSVSWDYGIPGAAGALLREPRAKINVTHSQGWGEAQDLRSFAAWLAESRDEDFLSHHDTSPSGAERADSFSRA